MGLGVGFCRQAVLILIIRATSECHCGWLAGQVFAVADEINSRKLKARLAPLTSHSKDGGGGKFAGVHAQFHSAETLEISMWGGSMLILTEQ